MTLADTARRVIAAQSALAAEPLVAEAVERVERWLERRADYSEVDMNALAYDITLDAPALSALLYAIVGFMADGIGWESHAARAAALVEETRKGAI